MQSGSIRRHTGTWTGSTGAHTGRRGTWGKCLGGWNAWRRESWAWAICPFHGHGKQTAVTRTVGVGSWKQGRFWSFTRSAGKDGRWRLWRSVMGAAQAGTEADAENAAGRRPCTRVQQFPRAETAVSGTVRTAA